MRIGAPAVSPWTTVWAAQLAQTVVQTAQYRSSGTDRPVEPISAIQDPMTLPRVGRHILDIRV